MRAPLLVVLFLATAASADEVVLTNGGKLVGKTRKDGDVIVVSTPRGEARLQAVEVKSITPGRTVWDDYADQMKSAGAKDAKSQLALGDWCRDHGLAPEARKHWSRAIEIDPDHAEARSRLGFLRYDDRWLTGDEYRRARGFVKRGDEWMPEEEARRRDAEKLRKDVLARHEKTIRDAIAKMQSMKRKTRLEGRLALQEYADRLGDLRLASFASEVGDFYNAQWKAIRKALVLVEVRATNATLKRPIPTITTSLGASSTPVTIQLPELSVVSVKTTALVPAEIELDDE
jgi:hypothetical protein